VADPGGGGRGGAIAPPKILKNSENTLDLIGFQKKKYTLALLVFFIKFAPLKKILDPPLSSFVF
jgi:hypothetical protein